MKIDKQTVAAIGAIVTALLGGAELRLAVSRVEANVQALADRVGHIENDLDASRQVSRNDQ